MSNGVAGLTVESTPEIAELDASGEVAGASTCRGLGATGVCEFCATGTYKAFYGTWDYRCDACQPCAAGSSRFACGGDTSGYCLSCGRGLFGISLTNGTLCAMSVMCARRVPTA